jgi:hypothetical protein
MLRHRRPPPHILERQQAPCCCSNPPGLEGQAALLLIAETLLVLSLKALVMLGLCHAMPGPLHSDRCQCQTFAAGLPSPCRRALQTKQALNLFIYSKEATRLR